MKPLVPLLLFLAWPMSAWPQADSSAGEHVALSTGSGTTLAYLTLGSSTPEEARRALDTLGGLGPRRENTVTFTIGGRRMRPPVLYTPPATSNQLYFDRGALVLLVAGNPQGLSATGEAFRGQFPTARVTLRKEGWYEMQAQLSPCVWLIAVFGATDDALQSAGYGYTCRKP